MSATPLFHLAFPVRDLAEARAFYGGLIGCSEGRSAADWCDFDFYGHQIVAYQAPHLCSVSDTSPVDGDAVPIRHFGAILPLDDWQALEQRLRAARVRFIIEPQIRFVGEIGEQHSMFFLDPSGNALEFKAFKDIGYLFRK
ncbi:MAG: VOC family protein [Proteobacteria bacterium]|nr:VOC family protein [Burkholderiales bacterium]